jgi:hypothetical protein
MKIYAIIKKVASGPRGHGEPHESFFALKTIEKPGYGEQCRETEVVPLPLYVSKYAAEQKMKRIDPHGFCMIKELVLEDEI